MTFRADRLLKVAQALRESPVPKLFDMGQWGYSTEDLQDIAAGDYCHAAQEKEAKKALKAAGKATHTCGTPACALGHYAARRDLQRAFKLDTTGGVIDRDNEEVGFVDYAQACPAIEEHFGISGDEPAELFGSEGCGKARSVAGAARFIERFVARKLKARATK